MTVMPWWATRTANTCGIRIRKPVMDSMTYNHLVLMAASKGFDVRKLEKTMQDG